MKHASVMVGKRSEHWDMSDPGQTCKVYSPEISLLLLIWFGCSLSMLINSLWTLKYFWQSLVSNLSLNSVRKFGWAPLRNFQRSRFPLLMLEVRAPGLWWPWVVKYAVRSMPADHLCLPFAAFFLPLWQTKFGGRPQVNCSQSPFGCHGRRAERPVFSKQQGSWRHGIEFVTKKQTYWAQR